ncbi:MAG: 50S ribosomal protein L9 [Patescibacteria group bacterium]
MKVIFLKDVPRVGKRNEVKEANDGYAMNFLIPKKLAELATPKSINALEQKKKEMVLERTMAEQALMKILNEIKDKEVTIKGKANEQGHLFSAIHKKEIVEALKREHKIEIGEDFIDLEKPLKETGEFEILVKVKDKKTSFKLLIGKI